MSERGPRFAALDPDVQAAVLALVALGYADSGDPTSPNTLRIATAVAKAIRETS